MILFMLNDVSLYRWGLCIQLIRFAAFDCFRLTFDSRVCCWQSTFESELFPDIKVEYTPLYKIHSQKIAW